MSFEDKGLVRYTPFQMSEFDDLKGIAIAKKPLEDQEIADGSIKFFDGESDQQKHNDIDTLLWIDRHRWDSDCWHFHEDDIYNTH